MTLIAPNHRVLKTFLFHSQELEKIFKLFICSRFEFCRPPLGQTAFREMFSCRTHCVLLLVQIDLPTLVKKSPVQQLGTAVLF